MKCSKCGAENNAGVKFCISCGSSLGMFCPNCGTANSAGAKFCVSCGNQFGVPAAAQSSAPTQPVVVLKSGTPGWAWAIIGVLLGILIIGGSIISGILPFGAASTEQVSPTLQPVVESPDASAEGFAEPGYCPETGGVILYWNAGFDCTNDTGDPGYRLRYGDGFQDLNTGKFDDQASSIHIPAGWSVRLYENVEKNGASHCFNTSVSNFEDFGNFDNRDLPVNDNVTSMQVFRDGTCGQDLAAGAEAAPMPEDVDLGLDAPVGAACTDQTPCACLPQALKDQLDERGFIDPNVFFDQYINAVIPEFGGGIVPIVFNPEFDQMMKDIGLKIFIGLDWIKDGVVDGGHFGEACGYAEVFDGNLTCEGRIPQGAELLPGSFGVHIAYESAAVFSWCATAQFENVGGMGGGPGGDDQPKDCRDPLVSCPDKQQCIESKKTGAWYCEPIKEVLPPTEEPAPPEPEATDCPSWCP